MFVKKNVLFFFTLCQSLQFFQFFWSRANIEFTSRSYLFFSFVGDVTNRFLFIKKCELFQKVMRKTCPERVQVLHSHLASNFITKVPKTRQKK